MAVNRSREEWKIYGNVFDKFTIELLRKLSAQGYFEELESAIAMGKEANVFLATTKDPNKIIFVSCKKRFLFSVPSLIVLLLEV